MGRSKGGKKDEAVVRTAPAAAPGDQIQTELTPVGRYATVESLKDVVPVEKGAMTGPLGLPYFDREYIEPNDLMPQVIVRIIRLDPNCQHGNASDISVVTDAGRPKQFWDYVPGYWLEKILKRDGQSFLPESFDTANLIEWLEILKPACKINLGTIRTMIDSASTNEGTQFMRPVFARLNRRCMEAESNLLTIETAPMWDSLGNSEPVVSPYDGGPVLLTMVDLVPIVTKFGAIDETHPAFAGGADITADTMFSSVADVNNQLGMVENAIRILRFQELRALVSPDSYTGFTWTAEPNTRGVKKDVQYMTKMLHELRFPSMTPVNSVVKIDIGRWNQKLYGEAIYGVDTKGVGTDVLQVYPRILTGTKYAYRRGFEAMSVDNERGMDEIWCGEVDENGLASILYGMKCEYGVAGGFLQPTKFARAHLDRYGNWSLEAGGYNLDDGTQHRLWLKECLASDHQWNEGMYQSYGSFTMTKTEQPAVYAFPQPLEVAFEAYTKYLHNTYNVPFRR